MHLRNCAKECQRRDHHVQVDAELVLLHRSAWVGLLRLAMACPWQRARAKKEVGTRSSHSNTADQL